MCKKYAMAAKQMTYWCIRMYFTWCTYWCDGLFTLCKGLGVSHAGNKKSKSPAMIGDTAIYSCTDLFVTICCGRLSFLPHAQTPSHPTIHKFRTDLTIWRGRQRSPWRHALLDWPLRRHFHRFTEICAKSDNFNRLKLTNKNIKYTTRPNQCADWPDLTFTLAIYNLKTFQKRNNMQILP